MGHVGRLLGLEMSRLARAGRNWHHLIELCSLAGALLADADGIYDPNWYNDRLLLGLKGTRHTPNLGPATFRPLPKHVFMHASLVPIRPVSDAWLISGSMRPTVSPIPRRSRRSRSNWR